ncbi:MAG: DUF952 domain-containing protein [Parvularculaceae bacterium]
MTLIYKIMSRADWKRALADGDVPLAEVDRHDGYVYLSNAEQVLETARLYFAGRHDLIIAEFDADDFGDDLKWEASRGGALFPHVYGVLPAAKARRAAALVAAGDGFVIGDEV